MATSSLELRSLLSVHCVGNADFPQILQYTTLNITTNEFCRKQYSNHPVTSDMLCATDNRGSRMTAACQVISNRHT